MLIPATYIRLDVRFDYFYGYTRCSFIRDLAHRDVMTLEERTNGSWPNIAIVFREHREDQLMLDLHGCLDSESL
jgi:hypothetical protein